MGEFLGHPVVSSLLVALTVAIVAAIVRLFTRQRDHEHAIFQLKKEAKRLDEAIVVEERRSSRRDERLLSEVKTELRRIYEKVEPLPVMSTKLDQHAEEIEKLREAKHLKANIDQHVVGMFESLLRQMRLRNGGS